MEKNNERASQREFFHNDDKFRDTRRGIRLAEFLVEGGSDWTFHLPILGLGAAFAGMTLIRDCRHL